MNMLVLSRMAENVSLPPTCSSCPSRPAQSTHLYSSLASAELTKGAWKRLLLVVLQHVSRQHHNRSVLLYIFITVVVICGENKSSFFLCPPFEEKPPLLAPWAFSLAALWTTYNMNLSVSQHMAYMQTEGRSKATDKCHGILPLVTFQWHNEMCWLLSCIPFLG